MKERGGGREGGKEYEWREGEKGREGGKSLAHSILSPGPSILLTVSGSVTLACGSTDMPAGKGATIFLPAASPDVRLLPKGAALLFQAYCNP